jgi:hypothetical protein
MQQVKRVACGLRNPDNYQGASCCTAQPAGSGEVPAVEVSPLKYEEPYKPDRLG